MPSDNEVGFTLGLGREYRERCWLQSSESGEERKIEVENECA